MAGKACRPQGANPLGVCLRLFASTKYCFLGRLSVKSFVVMFFLFTFAEHAKHEEPIH